MRQGLLDHVRPTVAEPVAPVVLSEDEQTTALMASVEDFNTFQQLDEENQRAHDIAIGLENLALVSVGIEEASNVHLGLIDVSTELALAGTGIDTEEALPGLEEMAGTQVSVESIRDMVAAIWKSIQEGLVKMWKAISGFWKRITQAIPRIKDSAESVKAKAAEMSGATQEEAKFKIGSEAQTLSVDYKTPSSGSDITESLNVLGALMDSFFGKQAKSLIAAGKDIADKIGSFDVSTVDAADSSLAAVSAATKGIDFNEVSKLAKTKVATNDKRFPKDAAVKSLSLVGNKSLFFTEEMAEDSTDTTLRLAEKHRALRVEIRETDFNPKEVKKGDVEISTISPEDVVTICDVVIKVCDSILDYDAKGLESTADVIKKATSDLQKKHDAAAKAEDFSTEIRQYVLSAANFNVAYTRWSTKTSATLTSLSVASCRAAITVARKSLSNYKK